MADKKESQPDPTARAVLGLLKRTSRMTASQTVLILFAFFSAIAIWSVSPLYNATTSNALDRLKSQASYSTIQEKLDTAIANERLTYDDRGFVSVTPLVRINYRFSTSAGETTVTPVPNSEEGEVTTTTEIVVSEYAELVFDFEAATIFFGFATILLVSTYVLVSQNRSLDTQGEKPTFLKEMEEGGVPDYLAQSAEFARLRATSIYSRSTYLLISGVIMAFVGIGVFYFSLTQELNNNSRYFNFSDQIWEINNSVDQINSDVITEAALTQLNARLDLLATEFDEEEKLRVQLDRYLQLLRAFGMLFFIEAVAWFLLRQYRQLVNDQKWAFGQYLKRSNFLAASQMTEGNGDAQMALLASILQEDHSGLLSQGQTTETLESTKANGANPVFDLFSKIIDRGAGKKLGQ